MDKLTPFIVLLRLTLKIDVMDCQKKLLTSITTSSSNTYTSVSWDNPVEFDPSLPFAIFRAILFPLVYLADSPDFSFIRPPFLVKTSSLFEDAIQEAFYRLDDSMYERLPEMARAQVQKRSSPSDLILSFNYSDSSSLIPNKTIDAGEESSIAVTITNKGKGPAFDVNLNTRSDYHSIQFPKTTSVGDIQPGESKDVEVKIKSDLGLEGGTVPFWIIAKEKRGFDSKKYELNIQAARLQKPNIVITSYKINDGSAGLGSGNGNGIPENGETIMFIPFVKNNGVGKAIQVTLEIESINSGIDIKQKRVIIPQIMPGQTVTGNLGFSIPRTYSGGKVKVSLKASDVRGASEAERLFAINTETHQPVLAYSFKILDKNRDGFLENGEEGAIEILPSNKGKMDANSVEVCVRSDDIFLSKKRMNIERISASSKYVPLRFLFRVPRTLQKDSVDVRLDLSQKDFAGLTDHINIPVKLVLPDLQITHQILDPDNNGRIEQGETVDLIVKIKNTGGLTADDVVLSLQLDQNGIIIYGDKKVAIGKIGPGAESEPQSFTINVQRTASVGALPVRFTISQKDFHEQDMSIALNIEKESPEVITVAGQKKREHVLPIRPVMASSPPVIAIASPRDNIGVASASASLIGTAVDDQGIADIEIMVNGRRLDTSRGIGIKGRGGRDQKDRDFRIKIPLNMGRNEITITAFDIENLSSSKSITVYRESERGEIWAVVIGINRYQNPSISLKYAKNDAKAFANYLRGHMRLNNSHLFELYDEKATLRKIRSALGTKLRKKANRPEDTVFIFFAGHGAPLEDSASKDEDKITKYILPYDADLDDLYSSAMPMDEIAGIFKAIAAQRVIFIADSCYSGGAGGRTILASGLRARLSDSFIDRLAKGKGRIVLTSCNANEVSRESDELGHGYFTYYLLKGLKGGADIDKDGLIDIDEIYRYLNIWVPERTKGAQHPVKKGQAEGQVVVGRVGRHSF